MSNKWKERLEELREELAVKWFMLDSQQKQAIILITVALWQGMIEVIVARLKGSGE